MSSYKEFDKIVVCHLNINSIKNKFDFLAHQIKRNNDILMISETKFNEIFLPTNFYWMATVSFSVSMGMVVVREDIPSKYIEINIHKKKSSY